LFFLPVAWHRTATSCGDCSESTHTAHAVGSPRALYAIWGHCTYFIKQNVPFCATSAACAAVTGCSTMAVTALGDLLRCSRCRIGPLESLRSFRPMRQFLDVTRAIVESHAHNKIQSKRPSLTPFPPTRPCDTALLAALHLEILKGRRKRLPSSVLNPHSNLEAGRNNKKSRMSPFQSTGRRLL
jgi:hypothetical protein